MSYRISQDKGEIMKRLLSILLVVFAFSCLGLGADVTLDMFEYSTSDSAQANYVSSGSVASQYPTQSDTFVKSTTKYSTSYWAYYATDPTKDLTGNWVGKGWGSANGVYINQRFHIDLGSGKIINRIYYENMHNAGTAQTLGVKNFTFWGTNTAGSFAELTYATDTGWTQLTTSQSTFDQHSGANEADPKYIAVTNSTSYRYYAFKFADNYSGNNFMCFRRIELQIAQLLCYSESTIKQQGSYSLKGVAVITDSLNDTLTRTVDPTVDLTGKDDWIFYIYSADRTGSNIKLGIHDSGGTTTESTPDVTDTGVWQKVTVDVSAVTDANKDDIDSIIITPVNADAANTFYIDYMYGAEAEEAENPTPAQLLIGGMWFKDGVLQHSDFTRHKRGTAE